MKKFTFVALALSLSLAGCKGQELKQYVERSMKLELAKPQGETQVATGTLLFKHTHLETRYRQVCETYACGEDCGTTTSCSGGGTSCTPVEHCTPSGCSSDSVCHTTPETCSDHYSCSTRYCTGNCESVPYTVPVTDKHPSSVTVRITGLSSSVKGAKIEAIALGVKTNSKFAEAVAHPPKGLEPIFATLKAEHKTVLVLSAKGYTLAASQPLLELPAGFKQGDAINIEVKVVPTGNAEEAASALGTDVDVPALHIGE